LPSSSISTFTLSPLLAAFSIAWGVYGVFLSVGDYFLPHTHSVSYGRMYGLLGSLPVGII